MYRFVLQFCQGYSLVLWCIHLIMKVITSKVNFNFHGQIEVKGQIQVQRSNSRENSRTQGKLMVKVKAKFKVGFIQGQRWNVSNSKSKVIKEKVRFQRQIHGQRSKSKVKFKVKGYFLTQRSNSRSNLRPKVFFFFYFFLFYIFCFDPRGVVVLKCNPDLHPDCL